MGLEGADYGSISSTLKFLKYMEEARGINDENPNDGKSTSASSTISKGEYLLWWAYLKENRNLLLLGNGR